MTTLVPYLMMLIMLVSACGSEVTKNTDICDSVSKHLASCGVTETPLLTHCVESDANEILGLSCADLTNPGKADLFSDVLCRVGVLFKCEVEECRLGEVEGFENWNTESCADYITAPLQSDCGSCDYYRCRSAISEQSCELDNYYLDFGNRYCLKYAQLTETRLSEEGQFWSQRIRTCLMNFAETNIENSDTCSDVHAAAIESHADCYVSTGFCELPVTDWLKVLATIDPSDFEFRSAIITGINCLKEFSNEHPGVIDTP